MCRSKFTDDEIEWLYLSELERHRFANRYTRRAMKGLHEDRYLSDMTIRSSRVVDDPLTLAIANA